MAKQEDDDLRRKVFAILTEEGLVTQLEPTPEDDIQFEAILKQLREVDPDNLKEKLILAGFAAHPVKEQQCFECMYYLVHRKFCELPELMVPVEAEWWCRLWRI